MTTRRARTQRIKRPRTPVNSLINPQIDYKRVQNYVEQNLLREIRMTKIVFLIISGAMFIVFNLIAWGLLLTRTIPVNEDVLGAGIILTMGWLTSLIFQAIGLFLESRSAQNSMRERLTLRGIQHEMARLSMESPDDQLDDEVKEKPKRIEYRLTDDGEIEEVPQDEPLDTLSKLTKTGDNHKLN